MTRTRSNVFDLGDDWAEPILWYARGVKAMKARALADPTSWRFYGGIHGFNSQLWQIDGYLSGSDQMPTSQQQATFWRQCQHGSWYFLPWHRGYLLALEANIPAAAAHVEDIKLVEMIALSIDRHAARGADVEHAQLASRQEVFRGQ